MKLLSTPHWSFSDFHHSFGQQKSVVAVRPRLFSAPHLAWASDDTHININLHHKATFVSGKRDRRLFTSNNTVRNLTLTLLENKIQHGR